MLRNFLRGNFDIATVKSPHNPVLISTRAEISGPGHNSVTNSPDGSDLFIVYHSHMDPQNPSGDRQVCIDRMGFREDGSLYVTGPTHTPQPIPSSKEYPPCSTARIVA